MSDSKETPHMFTVSVEQRAWLETFMTNMTPNPPVNTPTSLPATATPTSIPATTAGNVDMKCSNKDFGCSWEGAATLTDDHMASCEYSLIKCPKGCETFVTTKSVDHHVITLCPNRDFECELCGMKDTFTNIFQTHRDICPKKFMKCPNVDCVKGMLYEEVGSHVETECEHTVVPCPYEPTIGCSFESKRSAMLQHKDDSALHLDKAVDIVTRLKNSLALLQLKPLLNINDLGSLSFTLTGYEKKRNHNRRFVFPFLTGQKGYSMAVCVFANGDEYVDLVFGDKQYSEYGDVMWHHVDEYGEILSTDEESDEDLESDSDKSTEDEDNSESETDSIEDVVVPKNQCDYNQVAKDSDVCKDEDEEMEFDDDPTHISVVAMVLGGGEDAVLPFVGYVNVTLLNQLEDNNHMSKSFTFDSGDGDVKWVSHFVGHSELCFNRVRSTQYLVNDTLSFRVTVTQTVPDSTSTPAATDPMPTQAATCTN